MANQATLGGHVTLEDNVVIGGLSAVHQFCRIGELSMIGGMSAVENDVFPFALAIGNRAKITGLNLIGLKRANYEKSDIQSVNNFIKDIFSSNESIQNKISNINNNDNPLIKKISDFGIYVLPILAPLWWVLVGHLFDQNEAALWDSVLFLDTVAFVSDLLAVFIPSWSHFGSILGPLGPILARCSKLLAPCWHHFGAMLGIKVISENKNEHS